MKRSRLTWLVIGIFSTLVTVLLAGGFVYAVKDILYPEGSPILQAPKETTSERDANNIRIVGIGDSLTKGVGDESGKGYIGTFRDLLAQSTDKDVKIINNLAVGGYRTDQLESELDERGVRYALGNADIIVMTIGGNDLFSMGRDEIDPKVFEQRIPQALERLQRILAEMNELNPKAKLYYVGLYNPFADLQNGRDSSLVVQRWNNDVFALINQYPQMTFVPTFDLIAPNLDENLSSDNFHPSVTGYERIARRLLEIYQ